MINNKNKKMSRTILILLVSVITQGAYAQINYGTDSATCVTKYQIYRNDYKNENYEDALKSWRWVFHNCPQFNEYIFSNAPKIIYHQIKKNDNNKSAYIDTLMMVYDQRIQYFGRESLVLGKKGIDLLKYNSSKYEEAYEMLRKSVESLGNSSSPTAIVSYFKSITIMEKKTDQFEKQDVLNAYVFLVDVIDYNLLNNQKYEKNYKIALTNVENMFTPYASCEDLINVFQSKFEEGKEDVNFLKKITLLLSKKHCTDNELYFSAATLMHQLEPSASSAYEMGNMNVAKKNYSVATDYFNQAIKLEEDNEKKSQYYLQLSYAYQMNGSYSSARSAANSAASLRPNWGEPYLRIGDIYVSSASSCGDGFDRATVYWVAVDAFMKAKSVDEVLREKANKRVSTYSKYFPTKENCFFNDLQSGDSYKVKCWINTSTRVRTSD